MKDVINELKRRNINVRLKNEEDLEVLFPGDQLSDEDIREIRDKKPALVSYLKSLSGRNAFAAIKRAPKQDDYPVSSSQKRIWILCQFEGGSEAYSISSVYTIRESMDPEAFRRAFEAVISRHEILRTTFIINKDNEIRQVVVPPGEAQPDFGYSSIPEGQGALAKEKALKEISTPFQLDKGPLIRARLIRTGEKEYLAAFNIHHILADGWSTSILFREILELYRQFAGELSIGLPPLANQYKDYAVWEEQQLKSGQYEEARLYWMDQLSGELPVIHLPVDHPRPATKTFHGRRTTLKIDYDSTQRLRQLAGSKGGTLYMALMSVVNAWLYLYTEQKDIIIGAPVSGRVHVDIETQIGCYINTLAFRNRFDGACSFLELFSLVKATTLKAYDYQYYPFEQVVQDIALQRDPSRSPLFDIMVVLQNTEMPANREDQEEKSLDIKSDETETSTSRFDLGFEFREEQGGLNLTLEYNSDLFERTTIDSMLRIFRLCLAAMLATPDRPLNQLDYLGKEEKDTLLNWGGLFSDPQPDPQRPFLSAVEWFDRQAVQSPGQKAVRGKAISLTYRDLQTGADKLARQLVRLGIRPGDRVLLFMEKGPASLLGMLAIWKAGGIYVPLDADCPKERAAYILEETGAGLVISDAACLPVLPEGCNSIALAPDGGFVYLPASEEELPLPASDEEVPLPVIHPDTIAYIIYTSGSTGRPKGVLVSHGNLSHFLGHVQEKYGSAGPLSMPFIASPAFDISLFQVFAPWLSGGTVVTLEKDEVRDAGQLLEKLKGVNALDTVPGVYQTLVDHIDTNHLMEDLGHIRQLFIGGDTIPDELLQRLTGIFPAAAIIVTYGPTEGTIFCTNLVYAANQLPAAAKGTCIGSPIAGTRVYILNSGGQLLPPFAEGDIYLGGAGVSQGYFRQEQLTVEKFSRDLFAPGLSVGSPSAAAPSAAGTSIPDLSVAGRMYKTGDRGRWLPDGQLQFRGRQDAQVKVRGYRIELGEIEDCIRRQEDIAGAIVTTTGEDSYHRTLIACYVRKKPVQLWPSISEYLGYNDIAYYAMNKDELRAGSYRKAIYAAVKDKVVVDVGTGPEAILAQHCLKAGAKKVYAIEILEEVYQKAKEKIHSLGLQDRIILLLGNVMEIELPEQVDYCVCALVGNMGSSDGCIPIMNSARRFLKDTRNMIPFRSLVNIAAISLPEKNIVYPFSETGAYYINNIFSNTGRPFDLRIALKGVTENHLISTSGIFEDLDLTGELPLDNGHSIELEITTDGVMDGFLLWLNLHTAPGIVNDIFLSQESFLPVFFPVFSPPVKVNRGDRIEAYVWREFPEGVIYPEYGIRGKLIRQQGETIDFSYLSARYPDGFRRNEFYQRLFPNGEVPVKNSFSPEELRRYLARQLPDYMVPAVLVELDTLPLTANGKVDRRRLPELMAGSSTSSKYEGPRSVAEGKLTRIWSEVLNVEGIGIHDNFFEKGGHSLLATRVVSLIRRELGIDLSIRELFSYPTPALLSGWLQGRRITGGYPAIAVSREDVERMPLSYSQERLWFIDRLEGSVAYHLPLVLRLRGQLDKQALALSFARIMERHEVLRTVIREEEGEAWQELLAADNWRMGHGQVRRGQEAQQVAALTARPFHLSQDYQLRADLLDVDPNDDIEEAIIVVTLHHIASDGWSMGIIVRELAEIYEAAIADREAELPELPLQYADYALWQRRTIQGSLLEEKLDYWRRQLTGVAPLELPIDNPRPVLPSRRGGILQHRIGGELAEALNAVSRANGATLFMSLLAGFKILLYRYNGQTDICVGSPIAGRQQTEIEGVVGFFTNTLALRSSLDGNPSFRELLARVRETTLSAYDHQEVPFEKVVDAVVGERDLSRSPLFQVVLVLQNLEEIRPRVSLGGLEVRQEEWTHHTSKFDLVYSVTETSNGLALTVEYDLDLYEEATIQRMIGHYERLLVSITANPEGRIGELEILEAEEERWVGKEFAVGARYLPVPAGEGGLAASSGGLTLTDLLVAQAGRTPERVAVTDGEKSYSYAELSVRSYQLGNYLRRQGIKEDTLVGMYMEKGFAMITGILGILVAGGAYVPMDPEYPDDRIRYMLEDTGVKWVLSSGAAADRLRQLVTEWGLDLEVVSLENDLKNDLESVGSSGQKDLPSGQKDWLSGESAELPVTQLRPEHLAYIIYTSGSTGHPKGVMVEHRQVVRLLKPEVSLFDFGEEDVWTMFHSYCFDFSVWEIYGALVFGGRLVLVSRDTAREPQQFAALLAQEKVTVLNQTPSAYYVLQEELEKKARNLSLRYVIFGGEALNPAKVKRLGSACRLINMYGITETTVHVTYQELGGRELSSGRSLIGHPIPTLQVYILSKEQQLSPVGVAGEMYIGGEGVARGYWNREVLTAQRFVPDTFSDHEGARLYRSGDLGRWLPDGRIEYLGRIDEQVKIRGHRIELGEIVHAIGLSGLVVENVVLGRTGDNGGTQLAAYVVPGQGYSRDKLIACLQKKLPDYMIPSLWVEIEALPLTANGKLDRNALPAPGSDRLAGSNIAPRNGTEQQIAAIWEELLGIGPVGIMDNFFQLGGDSIMVIRVVSKIQKAFGHELKIADVYQAPTIEQLAVLLDGREAGAKGETPSHQTEAYALADAALIQLRETVLARLPDPQQIADVYPMSDIQQGMVFASLKDPGEAVYHVQEAYALPGDLDEPIFERALSMLVDKHVILRTAFDLGSHEKGLQIVYDTVAIRMDRVDISHLEESAAKDFLIAYVEGERRRPFIMDKAPLWRASLFKGKTNYIFLFQSHHAILDGWSVASMNTELGNVYLGLKANGYQGRLEPLRCSHRDYILSGVLQKEQEGYGEFWKKQLSGYSRLAIFLDEETRERSTRHYDAELWALLKQRTREDGVTPRTLFLGACLYALGQLTYEKDMTIGLVTNTRPAMEDGDKILGCFLNTIPLRIEISGSDTWKEYFSRIGKKLLELKGMDRATLFEISRICEDRSEGNPFFDVLFNFINFHIYDDLQPDKEPAPLQETPAGEDPADYLDYSVTNTFLDCDANITGDRLRINISLRRKLASGKSAEDLQDYMERVLRHYLYHQYQRLCDTTVISSEEKSRILAFSGKQEEMEWTLPDLIERHDRPAVVKGKEKSRPSGRQLNNKITDRMKKEGSWFGDIPVIPKNLFDTGGFYPATYQQHKEYTRYRIIGGYAYNSIIDMVFSPLGEELVLTAIDRTMQRHESLRTTFRRVEGKTVQTIHEHFSRESLVELTDLTGNEDREQQAALIYRKAESNPFDFEKGPLVSFKLIRYTKDVLLLLVVLHHVISDAQSLENLRNEMQLQFDACREGKEDPLPPLKVQIKEYARWVSTFMDSGKGVAAQRYYSEMILNSMAINGEDKTAHSYRKVLDKELKRALKREDLRDMEDAYGTIVNIFPSDGASYKTFIKQDLFRALKQLSAFCGSSLFMAMTAAIMLTFRRVSGKKSIRVSIPFSTRVFAAFEKLLGWLSSEIIIGVEVDESLDFRQFTHVVADVVLKTADHRLYPHEKLLADLDLPLNIVAPVLVNYIQNTGKKIGDESPAHEEKGSGHFNFKCTMMEYSDGLSLLTDYNQHAYQPADIETFYATLFALLEKIASHPSLPLNEITCD